MAHSVYWNLITYLRLTIIYEKRKNSCRIKNNRTVKFIGVFLVKSLEN